MDIDAPALILHWISEFGSLESVKWLLEHGASASIKDGNCNTALDWANRRKGGDGMIERQVENREVFRLLEEAVAREKEAGVNGEPEIKRASKKVVRLYRGGCELGQPLGEESRISSVSEGLLEVEGRIYGGPRATR
jgi:hypothetical protein